MNSSRRKGVDKGIHDEELEAFALEVLFTFFL